jgi:alkylated DNA repair dioxygenase AlkB
MLTEFVALERKENLLVRDGEMYYIDRFLTKEECAFYYELLFKNTSWKSDHIQLFGKEYVTKRKTAFYGDPGLTYTYSGKEKVALPWSNTLQSLKHKLEKVSGFQFNSCLLNLYHNGDEGMSWHSDNEKELGKKPVIASISLGEARKFSWKHKTIKDRYDLHLAEGSLLIMQGTMQEHWLHCIPKTSKVKGSRINLSFRQILH